MGGHADSSRGDSSEDDSELNLSVQESYAQLVRTHRALGGYFPVNDTAHNYMFGLSGHPTSPHPDRPEFVESSTASGSAPQYRRRSRSRSRSQKPRDDKMELPHPLP